MEWLRNVLESLESDSERLERCRSVLDDESSSDGAVATALEELGELLEDVDLAWDYVKTAGGLGSLLRHVRAEAYPVVRYHAALAVAHALQNHERCQTAALDFNVLVPLMEAVDAEREPHSREALVLALSAAVRGCAPAERRFVDGGGAALLARVLAKDDCTPKTRARAVFMASVLASSESAALSDALEWAPLATELARLLARPADHSDAFLEALLDAAAAIAARAPPAARAASLDKVGHSILRYLRDPSCSRPDVKQLATAAVRLASL